ncbi:UbiA family prenyltransferase [Malikia sp.]|uniref:UbiA family prenyltransferase n=1 Tax=Malikia sp. TaxID=2070706 RepID=UPI00262BDF22|nr:UbiA family prenyltransferase [Malikia sp.]MDD2727731.1 UbiA family prenyltransferase [Malikia sp.]
MNHANAAALPAWRAKLALYLDLIRWNRPAGWLLLLWPTLSALWVAADGWPGWHLLLVFTLGTILMRSAGCCINDVADRDFDRHVKRTAQRPITSGRMSVREALAVGAALAFAAFLLVLTTTPAAILLSVPALAVALAYPYAKRHVSMPQAVLGVAFSFGIPMTFAAMQVEQGASAWSWSELAASVPWQAWGLVVSNLFWVLAYDTEYAMVDRDDDLRIGMKTSAITLGRWDVVGVTAFYLLHLALWGGLLWPAVGGPVFGLALAAALGQVAWHHGMIRDRTREGCFRAFRLNHWLGLTLFLGVAGHYALKALG